MADDIVERLRFLVDDGWYPATHTEAADEIERLRAKVAELQALINAYAEASAEDDQYDHLRCMRAIGDLLDAATKDDADGR